MSAMEIHSLSNKLMREGMLSSLHSYNELATATDRRPEIEYAYCFSVECARLAPRVWKKEITKWQRRCPDCGKFLTWTTRLKPNDLKTLQKEREGVARGSN